jgi:uncharacterized iron-regulated membrane protein
VTSTESELAVPDINDEPSAKGALWRRLWRLHFLAGLIIMPALLWFAFTGLVVLYAEPINHVQHSSLYTVEPSGEEVSLDDQMQAVQAAYPDYEFWSVTPAKEKDLSNTFSMGDADGTPRNVFVNQYTGEVLGTLRPDKGLVSFANSTHGSILPRQFTMPIPSLNGIFGDGPAFRTVEIGEVAVEIIAGWGLILAISGLYMWWPRKRSKKRLFIPRFKEGGRPMWRDIHASSGVLLGSGLIFFVVTGLPWATFWGNEFSAVAAKVTPNTENFWEISGPPSNIPQVGDLARNGMKIPWASQEDSVPTSGGSMDMPGMDMSEDGSHDMDAMPAPAPAERVGLEAIYRAAQEEKMLAGFSIAPPTDTVNDDGSTSYGAFVVMNPWPSSLGQQGALYLDQFSAKTLGTSDADTWGAIQRVAELGVQTHMGTQFGVINRIVLTLVCVMVIVSISSALNMWLRRRRKGSLGVPRRPAEYKTQKTVGIVAVVLGIVYPLWGMSALLLLGVDFVIRRIKASRTPNLTAI